MRLQSHSYYVSCFRSPLTALAAAPAVAQTPYDGLWHVTIVTKTGSLRTVDALDADRRGR